ncbi:MAG: hypothetical protein ABMB14_40700 [Myxococcota bacterium]
MVWLALLAACTPTRPVTSADKRVALTASDVAYYTAKYTTVDPDLEHWRLEQSHEGWGLSYEYATDTLAIEYRALLAPNDRAAGWAWDTFGLTIIRAKGVEMVDAPNALHWGTTSECRWVRVTGHDIGFTCRGRSDRRMFSVNVYGVPRSASGAPGPLLSGPLAALEAWNPAAER